MLWAHIPLHVHVPCKVSTVPSQTASVFPSSIIFNPSRTLPCVFSCPCPSSKSCSLPSLTSPFLVANNEFTPETLRHWDRLNDICCIVNYQTNSFLVLDQRVSFGGRINWSKRYISQRISRPPPNTAAAAAKRHPSHNCSETTERRKD